MKVLYLVHQFYPEFYTGTEKFICKMASMTQRAGHSARVVTYSFNEDSFFDKEAGDILFRDFIYKGIPVTALRHKRIPETIHLALHDGSMAGAAEHILSREMPDVIHAGHLMRVHEFINTARGMKIPYLVTLTDFWLICPNVTLINSNGDLCRGPGVNGCLEACPALPESIMSSRFAEARTILSGARKVVSPSVFLGSLFRRVMEPLEVAVINHGMSYSRIRKNRKKYRQNDPVIFCYAGSLNEHKGVHLLIRAFKEIASGKAVLKIYGSGPDPSYVNKLHEMVAGDQRIEFCGVYSEEATGDIFAGIDVAVIPSLWYENYPLVLHEALACSVPVVASGIGGMAEKITDGSNGYTFPVGDVGALAKILSSIADNPLALNGLKKKIMEFISPSIEQEAYSYSLVYQEILSADVRQIQCPPVVSSARDSMKILLAVHVFFPEYTGGTEVLVRDTAKILQSRGYDVRIFTASPVSGQLKDGERFDSYNYDGLTVERFYHSLTPMGEQTNVLEIEYNNLFFAGYFREFLKSWKPDVVHFFHLQNLTASAIEACDELGIPVVYTATDFWPVCLLSQLRQYDNSLCSGPDKNSANCIRHFVMVSQPEELRSKMSKLPDWLLAVIVFGLKLGVGENHWVSPYVKALTKRPGFMIKRLNMIRRVLVPTHLMRRFLERHGVDKSRICFQQFGINMEYFDLIRDAKPRGSGEKLRVGFIGALFEHKGAHILIEAVRSLPVNMPLEVKIYGNLNQNPKYSETLKSLAGDDSRIVFCGHFSNDQIGIVFTGLDVLVVPSIWYENTPLVIYSAQADGCPVIATNLGGLSEVVKDRVNGLLFEKGDVAGLAGKIALLANDRKLLAELEKNTKRPKAMTEYVDELESYYKEVIAGNGRPR